jgi:import receptor subunit TOM20
MASSSLLSSIPRQTLIAVGCATASVAFIGYCVYFDRKRRSAPDFKEKLRESRYSF